MTKLAENFSFPYSTNPEIPKRKIGINVARFWTGATASQIIDLLLCDLSPYFDFEVSDSPQVLLYGPYSGRMPKGAFTRVFIGSENCLPIMSECDWAFGVVHEDRFRHPRYMRLQRWGDDRFLLQKSNDWRKVLRDKDRFCAFIYSHRVPYREAFFRALSRYKKIDSPGRSLNNMPNIDPTPGKLSWAAKIEFLQRYKFVISFENGSRSGYNTEKLTDAIQANCLPIYWGDPQIARSFNVRRFINAHDYLITPLHFLPKLPYKPHSVYATELPNLFERLSRRLNGVSDHLEQYAWGCCGFAPLVDYVAKVDKDDELYISHLSEPLFSGNSLPDRARWIQRWCEIFGEALGRV